MRLLAALDLRLLRLLRTRGHTPPVEISLIQLARAGENGLLWYVIALAGAALDRRGHRDAYFRAMTIVLAAELPALTPVLSGRSYPSAHTSTSFAGARALAAAGLPAAPLYAVAVAMGLSRPYLGVHYPSDILAGALLGDAVGRFMTP